MKSDSIQAHPRLAELRLILKAHPDWLKPWSGLLFRFQTVDFPAVKDILSGDGARQYGGRWNRPGLATLYGSTTDTAALHECKAHDRYYGIETTSPRLLVAIEAQLARVLDLTSPAIRRALGVTQNELVSEDWRKLLQSGRESMSQALGLAAASAGASGLLARSAATPLGTSVAVFPGAHQHDRLVVVEGEKLTQLRLKTRA
jgi:RES domain-containing protein